MKKSVLAAAVLFAAIASVQDVQAQNLMDKLKGAVSKEGNSGSGSTAGSSGKPKKMMEFSTTKTDEWGISGNYMNSEGIRLDVGKYARQLGVEFTREKNGVVVNELLIPTSLGNVQMKLEEKVKTKHNIILFSDANGENEIMQLEKDVLFFRSPADNYYVVMVKDEAALQTWDNETAYAVYEKNKGIIQQAKDAALIEKLNGYDTYKQYKGKIAFVKTKSHFDAEYYNDTPSEDSKNFLKEWVTGDYLFLRAYFTKSFESYCTSCDKKVNFVLEMGKHKVDWMELRSSSSAYSSMYVPSTMGNRFMTGAVWMWDNFDYNRALIHIIHLNIKDGSLKEGGSMPLKISIYPYADKTNKEKMAEGSISIKLNSNNGNWSSRYNSYKSQIE